MPGGTAPRRKGFAYERELVEQATAAGLDARRAWGSNGQSLGYHEEVDLVVAGVRLQAKRRKSVPKYLSQYCTCQTAGGLWCCVVPWDQFLCRLGGDPIPGEWDVCSRTLAPQLTPGDEVDGVVTRADRAVSLAIVRLDWWVTGIRRTRHAET